MNKYERTHEELKRQLEQLGVYDTPEGAEERKEISSEVTQMLSDEEVKSVKTEELANRN